MAHAVEKILGEHLAGGVIVTKYGHGVPLKKVDLSRPVTRCPMTTAYRRPRQITALVKSEIRDDDLVLCLISGGASFLLVSPPPGVTLQDKLECTQLLLRGARTL